MSNIDIFMFSDENYKKVNNKDKETFRFEKYSNDIFAVHVFFIDYYVQDYYT